MSALVTDVVTQHALHRWHLRFGHLGISQILRLPSTGAVTGISLPPNAQLDLPMCDSCVMGKFHRLNIPKTATRASPTDLLSIVAADIAIVNHPAIGNYRHYIVFFCLASHRNWVYLLRNRSDILACFKDLYKLCLVQYGIRIRCLRADGEFPTTGFREFGAANGITFEFTCADSSFQNGHAERFIRTIREMSLTMLLHSGLPLRWWGEFVLTASYILNRSPVSALGGRTPYEIWKKSPPNVTHFRVVGCLAWVRIPQIHRDKLQPKAKPLVFIGYSEERKGWKFGNPVTDRITYSRDAVFDETRTYKPLLTRPPSIDQVDQLIPASMIEADHLISRSTSLSELASRRNDSHFASVYYTSEVDVDSSAYSVTTAFVDGVRVLEPKSYTAALKSLQREHWIAAMDSEMESLSANKTWELQPLPPGRKAIRTKWVFKVKQNSDGSIERYKARLVALGFSQRENVDYFETFAPVARYETLRFLFAYAAHFRYFVEGLDVSTAFLNGDVEEEIFVHMPQGFTYPDGKDGFVGRLRKALYGLKQSPRAWHQVLLTHLFSLGFKQSNGDPCLLYLNVNNNLVLFLIYVDDLNYVCPDSQFSATLKASIMQRFKCRDLGRVDWLLGMSISYPESGGIFINQEKYILDLLERFRMTDCYPVHTPADCNVKFTQELCSTDEKSVSKVRSLPYRAAVGALLHLSRCTRPDIAYIVHNLSRFLSNFGPAHWTAVLRVFAYLKATSSYGLFYQPGTSTDFTLSAWCDAAFADDLVSRRSTCGFVTFLAGAPLTWKSGLQPDFRPSLSTTESEYVALFLVTKEVVWLRTLMKSVGCSLSAPTPVHEDNTSTVALARDAGVFHARTKHIDIKYHYVRSCLGDAIDLISIRTTDQFADILTKALPKALFTPFRDQLLKTLLN